MRSKELILLMIVGFVCIGMAAAADVVVQGGVKACSAFAAPLGADFGASGLDATLSQPILSPDRSYTISWCGPYDVKCEAMAFPLCLADGKLTTAALAPPKPITKLHDTLKLDFSADPINKIFDCGDITMPIESGSGTPSTTHTFKYSQNVLYTDIPTTGYTLTLKWTASAVF